MLMKRAATIALLGACIAAGAGSGAPTTTHAHQAVAVAHASKIYVNKKTGYSIRYPASWTRQAPGNQDLVLSSPSGTAFLTTHGVKGTATKSEIKAQQKKVLTGLGQLLGKVSYAEKAINGVPFQLSEAVVKSKGKQIDLLVIDTVLNGYLYDFEAFVVLKGAHTNREIKQVQSALNSITIG